MGGKFYFALLSLIGFTGGLAILFFFKPGMTVRTFLVGGSALVLCVTIIFGGDLFVLEPGGGHGYMKEMGWISLGLLFGSGRGEYVVAFLNKIFAGKNNKDTGLPKVDNQALGDHPGEEKKDH